MEFQIETIGAAGDASGAEPGRPPCAGLSREIGGGAAKGRSFGGGRYSRPRRFILRHRVVRGIFRILAAACFL